MSKKGKLASPFQEQQLQLQPHNRARFLNLLLVEFLRFFETLGRSYLKNEKFFLKFNLLKRLKSFASKNVNVGILSWRAKVKFNGADESCFVNLVPIESLLIGVCDLSYEVE